ECEIETRFRPRPHRTVEKIAPDVTVLRKRVGAAKHERAAIQHVRGVEDPRCRHVHDVALKDLDANEGHQPYDQPCGSLAGPGADAVDRIQKALRVHARCRPVNGCPDTVQVSTKLASSGIAAQADASITRATVRSSFSRSARNSGCKPCAGSQPCLAPTASYVWRMPAEMRRFL